MGLIPTDNAQCQQNCMFFLSNSANKDPEPAVIVAGRRPEVLNECKYLGIITVSVISRL